MILGQVKKTFFDLIDFIDFVFLTKSGTSWGRAVPNSFQAEIGASYPAETKL